MTWRMMMGVLPFALALTGACGSAGEDIGGSGPPPAAMVTLCPGSDPFTVSSTRGPFVTNARPARMPSSQACMLISLAPVNTYVR